MASAAELQRFLNVAEQNLVRVATNTGGIYGTTTASALQEVFNAMIEASNHTSYVKLVGTGSDGGRILVAAKFLHPEWTVWGIEAAPYNFELATATLTRAGENDSRMKSIVNVFADAREQCYEDTTHVYSFDTGMPHYILTGILDNVLSSPSVQVFASHVLFPKDGLGTTGGKISWEELKYKIPQISRLSFHKKIEWTIKGSEDKHTCYVYKVAPIASASASSKKREIHQEESADHITTLLSSRGKRRKLDDEPASAAAAEGYPTRRRFRRKT